MDRQEEASVRMKVLSFGAGVQSTTMLIMSLEATEERLERPDCVIFADTGWEPKAVYEHLENTKAFCDTKGMPFYIVSAGNLPEDVLRHIKDGSRVGQLAQPPLFVSNLEGKIGTLWRQCTKEYKIDPIRIKVRELLGIQKGKRVPKDVKVEMWKGISIDEAHRMKDSRDAWIVNQYPLIDMKMTRGDCVRWLKAKGYPVPGKSACIGCPFHSQKSWIEMMKNNPEEFKNVEEFDAELRLRPFPGAHGPVYVHRGMLPLREAVEATIGDKDQGDLFGQECEGVCGV